MVAFLSTLFTFYPSVVNAIMLNNAPTISTPYPTNNSLVSSSLTQIRINIVDLETFNYTMELSNGINTFGNNVSNGTKILNLGGSLNDGTIYIWWVNASDGINTSTAWYRFTTTNTSGVIGGNITVTFDSNQFAIIILMILTFFFLYIGIIVNDNRFAGLILLFDGLLMFNLMIAIVITFGAIWLIVSPGFILIALLLWFYGAMKLTTKGKGK